MNSGNALALTILGVGVVVGLWLVRRFLSSEARWERRRRRSNRRVSSTANRPMVKLSVKTKKGRRSE